jgi:ectoine hydroxylase-related dioxygenase (phytanoyl-CoA dioxygenase family)
VLNPTLTQQLADDGFCIVPGALPGDVLEQVRQALDVAVEQMLAAGQSTHIAGLDPNASNVRVNVLPAFDQLFVELLRWPSAREVVHHVLGPDVLVSNFSANIALPGSQSMAVHSDQALVVPEPWTTPWAMNIIWCLDDVRHENGATLYLPGSHRFTSAADVPADAAAQMKPFEAPAGSFIAMDGRLWHTSGANVTKDERRRALFAYYSKDFIRGQITWEAALPRATKEALDEDARQLLGLGPMGNARIGGQVVGTRS